MKRSLSTSQRAGFSLAEIIVGISFISILAGTVAMRSGGMIDRGKTSEVVSLARTFKAVCASYHADVGSYAREYANSSAGNRRLSADQPFNGWSGPYIESPLAPAQNPFGGTLHLYDNVRAAGRIPGFDVDGDGRLDVKGTGNMLFLTKVEHEDAEAIDKSIDGSLAGYWSKAGRVRYKWDKKELFILVYY